MTSLRRRIPLIALLLGTLGCGMLPGASPTPALPTQTMVPTELPPLTATAEPTAIPPTVTPGPVACAETAGSIEQGTLRSDLLGGEMGYRVYTPPCYGQLGVRYPLLLMLHGMTIPAGQGMDDSMWDRIGLDEAATAGAVRDELPPLIIVMPNGEQARHDDDTGPYARVLVEELLPEVETAYCTWQTREGRAIGGLSRGAYWAFSAAFTAPETFSRVGGHSGFFYSGEFPQTNPYNMIPTAEGIEGLQMYLDRGADDAIVAGRVEDFRDQLINVRGIQPEYTLHSEGDHTEEYWSEHAREYLDWYTRDWPQSADDYPPCEAP